MWRRESNEYFRHMWKKHPGEAAEQRAKAQETRLEKEREARKATESPEDDKSKPPKEQKEKAPPPTGIKDIGDLRSRMVPLRLYSDTVYLDTSVIIFYDITRLKDPNYKRTVAEWLTEVVTLFYHEHRADFGIENLFAQYSQQVAQNEQIAEVASEGAAA